MTNVPIVPKRRDDFNAQKAEPLNLELAKCGVAEFKLDFSFWIAKFLPHVCIHIHKKKIWSSQSFERKNTMVELNDFYSYTFNSRR